MFDFKGFNISQQHAIERAPIDLILPCIDQSSDDSRNAFASDLIKQMHTTKQKINAVTHGTSSSMLQSLFFPSSFLVHLFGRSLEVQRCCKLNGFQEVIMFYLEGNPLDNNLLILLRVKVSSLWSSFGSYGVGFILVWIQLPPRNIRKNLKSLPLKKEMLQKNEQTSKDMENGFPKCLTSNISISTSNMQLRELLLI